MVVEAGSRPGDYGKTWSDYNREVVVRGRRKGKENKDTLYVEEVERTCEDKETLVVKPHDTKPGIWVSKAGYVYRGRGQTYRQAQEFDEADTEIFGGGAKPAHRITTYRPKTHFDHYVLVPITTKGRSRAGKPTTRGEIDKPAKTYRPRNNTPDDVLIVMEQFRVDPLGTIVRLGKATGRCCFCGSGLTDRRSRSHGYGPVCAKTYGLDWSHEHADKVENEIEEAVGRCVMELRPGQWSVVDLETNTIMVSYPTYEQAQDSLDEWSRLERTDLGATEGIGSVDGGEA